MRFWRESCEPIGFLFLCSVFRALNAYPGALVAHAIVAALAGIALVLVSALDEHVQYPR
jgi:hypothetical protein